MAQKEKTMPALAPAYKLAVPAKLKIPADPLRMRLDIHNQTIVMTNFQGDVAESRVVAAMDLAHAIASEMTYTTGFLPAGALWWSNTKAGPVTAVYEEPRIRWVNLKLPDMSTVRRFKMPLPGLIFLCAPGMPPWVYAVKSKPGKTTDVVYKAPLSNIFDNGRSCPGSHHYPADVGKIVDSFFTSFFSEAGSAGNRSQKFPDNIVHLWEFLHNKKEYPLDDLVRHGTVADLMRQEMER